MQDTRSYGMMLAVGLLLSAPFLATAHSSRTTPEPDRIDVIAQVPLPGGPVAQLTSGTHWRRDYLYADHGSHSAVTVLDVTNPAAPAVVRQLDIPKQESGGDLRAVVGTAALISSSPATPTRQTVTIMSFADPEKPKVVQQFSGVTSTLKDTSRGLIYLVNPEGLWILRMEPATDVELQKEYDNYVRYNR